jgi:hypothetical protein
MFFLGFRKMAVSYANLTPEEIAEQVSEKYPYQGAVYGAVPGAIAGAIRHKKNRYKGALVGAAAAGAAGAGIGHARGAWHKYKTRRLQREVQEYNLRATPRRYSYQGED